MKRIAVVVVALACLVTASVAQARSLSVDRAKLAVESYAHRISAAQNIVDYEVSACRRPTKTKVVCSLHILADKDCDSRATVRFKSAKSNALVVSEGPRTCV